MLHLKLLRIENQFRISAKHRLSQILPQWKFEQIKLEIHRNSQAQNKKVNFRQVLIADEPSTIGVLVKTARKSARLTLPQAIANLLGEDCGNNLNHFGEKSV